MLTLQVTCETPIPVKRCTVLIRTTLVGSNFIMHKKQSAVSHSCAESELVSLDAGLRMDALPAL